MKNKKILLLVTLISLLPVLNANASNMQKLKNKEFSIKQSGKKYKKYKENNKKTMKILKDSRYNKNNKNDEISELFSNHKINFPMKELKTQSNNHNLNKEVYLKERNIIIENLKNQLEEINNNGFLLKHDKNNKNDEISELFSNHKINFPMKELKTQSNNHNLNKEVYLKERNIIIENLKNQLEEINNNGFLLKHEGDYYKPIISKISKKDESPEEGKKTLVTNFSNTHENYIDIHINDEKFNIEGFQKINEDYTNTYTNNNVIQTNDPSQFNISNEYFQPNGLFTNETSLSTTAQSSFFQNSFQNNFQNNFQNSFAQNKTNFSKKLIIITKNNKNLKKEEKKPFTEEEKNNLSDEDDNISRVSFQDVLKVKNYYENKSPNEKEDEEIKKLKTKLKIKTIEEKIQDEDSDNKSRISLSEIIEKTKETKKTLNEFKQIKKINEKNAHKQRKKNYVKQRDEQAVYETKNLKCDLKKKKEKLETLEKNIKMKEIKIPTLKKFTDEQYADSNKEKMNKISENEIKKLTVEKNAIEKDIEDTKNVILKLKETKESLNKEKNRLENEIEERKYQLKKKPISRMNIIDSKRIILKSEKISPKIKTVRPKIIEIVTIPQNGKSVKKTRKILFRNIRSNILTENNNI